MATKLFVGSLPWGIDDDRLKELFSSAGTVVSANVIVDRDTRRSKGYGFVEMSSDEEAKEAISQFDKKEIEGRQINVSEAKPREERPNRR